MIEYTTFHLVCSLCVIFPLFISLLKSNCIILVTSLLSGFLAVMHSAVLIENNNSNIINGFAAADALCGVVVTLAAGYTLSLFKTCLGTFRVLWLVALVTSSNGYAFVKNVSGQAYLPNDITIIALGVSAFVLIMCAIYIKCQRSRITRTIRHQIAEGFLVLGAFIIRFDDDIYRIIEFRIGFSVWHLCCWICLTVCCFITTNDEDDELNNEHGENAL